VSSLSYPACKAHAPYYIVVCGLSGSTKFFHITLSHKQHKFLENKVRVLIFSALFARNMSHSKKNSARYKYA
jgi:hypothetical protein